MLNAFRIPYLCREDEITDCRGYQWIACDHFVYVSCCDDGLGPGAIRGTAGSVIVLYPDDCNQVAYRSDGIAIASGIEVDREGGTRILVLSEEDEITSSHPSYDALLAAHRESIEEEEEKEGDG